MNFITLTNGLSIFYNYEVKFEINGNSYDIYQENKKVDFHIFNPSLNLF